jgi:hypothetical protein
LGKYWINPQTNPYVYIDRNVRFPISSQSIMHLMLKKDAKGKKIPGSREKVKHSIDKFEILE